MYDIIFYEDKNNHSEIVELLNNLQDRQKLIKTLESIVKRFFLTWQL